MVPDTPPRPVVARLLSPRAQQQRRRAPGRRDGDRHAQAVPADAVIVKLDRCRALLAECRTATEAQHLAGIAEAVRVYAKRVGAGVALVNEAVEYKIRAERRLGEIIVSERPGRGQPKKNSSHEDEFFSPKIVARARKLAAIPAPILEERLAETRLAEGEITLRGFLAGETAARIVVSKDIEWYTPARYVEAARAVMGGIDLDPASSTTANRTVKAARIYDSDADGLTYPWAGRVFLNPPYGGATKRFVEHLLDDLGTGRVTQAILLVNAHCTDAEWFRPLWDGLLCFTDHRIDFDSPDRKENSSTHGSVFVYFGPNMPVFKKEFSVFGAVVRRA